ncbi:MAG TPA: endolytic transglycosylase MltG, partial [Candidatus Saccharimonadales bacterium]|nr:endolytic transglycosylase MltG [Candidatus Saccharimonadales bacterium]
MAEYSLHSRVRRVPKRLLYVAAALLVLLVVAVVVVRQMYANNLRPVSGSTEVKVVTIEPGSNVSTIADILYANGLIRQERAFEQYVRSSNLADKLQAGTYKFSPSLSVQEITQRMAEGKVAVDLVTIVPGYRLDQVEAALTKAGFDQAAARAALDPAQYAGSPALADKPVGASLEGFLYPDSYQKSASTDPKSIISLALGEMEQRLTPELRAQFARQGLSVFQAVTLASVVEREVARDEDRAQVAQVFYKRLRSGMALESDATALYGAVLAGESRPSVTFESSYNTYSNKGLPPGPISNVTQSSLQAVARPAGTDWTYFVSGDDG